LISWVWLIGVYKQWFLGWFFVKLEGVFAVFGDGDFEIE